MGKRGNEGREGCRWTFSFPADSAHEDKRVKKQTCQTPIKRTGIEMQPCNEGPAHLQEEDFDPAGQQLAGTAGVPPLSWPPSGPGSLPGLSELSLACLGSSRQCCTWSISLQRRQSNPHCNVQLHSLARQKQTCIQHTVLHLVNKHVKAIVQCPASACS